jgi:hypothetical protein
VGGDGVVISKPAHLGKSHLQIKSFSCHEVPAVGLQELLLHREAAKLCGMTGQFLLPGELLQPFEDAAMREKRCFPPRHGSHCGSQGDGEVLLRHAQLAPQIDQGVLSCGAYYRNR